MNPDVARIQQTYAEACQKLIDQLYDMESYVTRNAVEAHISSLRKRLRAAGAPKLVETRRGFGYLIE